MPKSKNRKKHKQKSKARGINRLQKRNIQTKENKARMDQMMEHLKKQIAEKKAEANLQNDEEE